MKKILFLLFLSFNFFDSKAVEVFRNKEYHFSFTIPNQWEVMEGKEFKMLVELLKKQSGYSNLNALADLYFNESSSHFDYPYVIICFTKNDGFKDKSYFETAVKQLKKISSEFNYDDSLKKYNLSDWSTSTHQGEYIIDNANCSFMTLITSDIANYGELVTINKTFCFKYGMINVYCYSLKKDLERFKGSFNIILSSFQFEKDFQIIDA